MTQGTVIRDDGSLRSLSGLDLEEVLQRNAVVAADVCQAEWAAVFLLSEESQLLHCVALHPPRKRIPAGPLNGGLLWARVVKNNAPEVVNRFQEFSAAEQEIAGRLGVKAALAVPIVVNERCLGALVVAVEGEGGLGPDELTRSVRVAHNVAAAVERANLYLEATERIAELSLLHEVGQAFNESRELSEILGPCADQLAALLDASGCYILLKEGDVLRCVAGNGPLHEDIPLRGEPSLAVMAVTEGRALVSTEAPNDPRVNKRLRDRFGAHSVLAIPMMHRGRAIGAVLLDERRSRRLFTPAQINRVSLLADQLAAAVENARLYEGLRQSYGEQAEAQAKLVQRERLAALGELSAQVAHEVRNPLGVIFNAVGQLRKAHGELGQTGYLLNVLGEEAERINRIIGDLIDFARPRDLALQGDVLLATLADAEKAALAGSKVQVEHDFEDDLSRVALDARQMRQAFLNLFQNAVQAMQDDGLLRISARVVASGGRSVAEVVVEDSGPGVKPALRHRIFEPFFTTKAAGIGLGLAVVKRIVEAHQGEVSVGEGRRGGAAFVLRWPSHL